MVSEFIATSINDAPNICTQLLAEWDQGISVKYNALYSILNSGGTVIPISASVELVKSIVVNFGSSTDLQAKDVVRQLLPG